MHDPLFFPPSQVGPKGKVIGIDHIKELVDDSINNVKKDDPSLITSGRVTLVGKTLEMAHKCTKCILFFFFLFLIKQETVQ